MKNFIKFIFGHKIILAVVIIGLAVSGYFGYQKIMTEEKVATEYVTSKVARDNIVALVSGTGQVAVSDQVEVKPDASGKVINLGVVNGQAVKAGTIIVQLDAASALQSVRDAEDNLESAKLALEKLQQPASELEITKAKNTLVKAEEALPNAQADLVKSYEDGYNDIADVFLDLPTLMAGLDSILFGDDFSNSQWNVDYYETRAMTYDERVTEYKNKAKQSYEVARVSYEDNFDHYKNSNRYSDEETVEALIEETYGNLKNISEAVKDIKNFIDFYEDVLTKRDIDMPSQVATHQNDLESYTGIASGHLSAMFSDLNSLDTAKESIVNAQRTLTEQQQSLAELMAGTDPLDIRSQELTIKQRENALLEARQNLADYTVRAPFDGIIAEVSTRLGESVSSGTTIATLITSQKIAEITLNEIDSAKVEVGQRSVLTFDAVPDLSITGEVGEIDTLGTVSQGVVSYGIKIVFDVQDERIKPGMSLSASVIVDSRQNVLTISSSAVKTIGDNQYVEILNNGQPERQTVTTGLSNDTMVEIVAGLEEGAEVITQTINNSASQSSSQSSQNSAGGNDAMRGVFQLSR